MPKETLTMRMYKSTYVCSFLHAYVGLILHTYSDFQKFIQDKFSVFMLRFGTNPTSSGDRSKPFFSHYKNPYMVYFQNTYKSHGKTIRITRNSESKGSFS